MRRLVRHPNALVGLVLLLAPLLWFAPVVLGGKTLLPADNLYQFQPWAALAEPMGATTPHNELLSDLVLENLVWKSFLRETLAQGELPLWNPHIFSGVPFLAAGQHSALYPLSLVFYLLPLSLAYGVFTWLQFALTGWMMYLFGRSLRLGRAPSLLAGLAYAFSGFMVVSVVFTMIIAAAAWLPALLACIESIFRKQEEKGDVPYSPIPYVVVGSLVLGVQILAGHPEIVVITLLVAGFYTLARLLMAWRRVGSLGRPLRLAGWLLVMVVLGLALGAAQLMPLYELVSASFRQGSASFAEVVGWAWPSRQIVTFLLPDFFGNPSHHGWWDPALRAWRAAGPNALGQPVRDVFWGVKNYVEGGNYLGVMTLLLAALAVAGAAAQAIKSRSRDMSRSPERPAPREGEGAIDRRLVWLLAALAVISLLFAFGTPLYALLFYGVPGYKQLHSAFRWVFPYTLAMTALAGFGLQWVLGRAEVRSQKSEVRSQKSEVRGQRSSITDHRLPFTAYALLAAGLLILGAALLSMVVPGPFHALGQRVVDSSDLARGVFANGADFWGYQWRNVLHLGAFTLLAGLWLLIAAKPRSAAAPRTARFLTWPRLLTAAAMLLLLLDLNLVLGRFNPAVDPDLLDVTPESVAFLQQEAEQARQAGQPWRMTSFEGADTTKTFNANTPWLHGLHDVRGYDSIITKQYVDFMQAIEPQGQLLYNRISPFYDPASLDDPLTDLLGVRYVATELPLDVAGWELAFDDPAALRIYRNADAFPRAFIAQEGVLAPSGQVISRTRTVDLHDVVVLEQEATPGEARTEPGVDASRDQRAAATGFQRLPADYAGQAPADELPPPSSPDLRTATISHYGSREVFVDLNLSDRGWLVLTDAWFPGWKAYLRPFGVAGEGVDAAGNALETELPVFRADGNFRAVYIPADGQWTVRFVYSPRSVQLGLYASFLAVITLMLLMGFWAWGRYYREVEDEHAEVRRVAKNTGVQMILSLLNRGIDFAFAMLRLRILGPVGEGSYAFVIAIYGFFEVVVRFGLGTLLTRDVAQNKEDAGRYLANVLAVRVLLWLISLPVLVLVAGIYAASGSLTGQEAQALALFAAALLFASVADSISSVFMAYEKMEYPAGIATAIATAKVALGALVLLPPISAGFVGLAAVSLAMNIVQSIWLWIVLRRQIPLHLGALDRALQKAMLIASYPLMLNHLLASIFWRIDLWLLKPMAGAASVGIYSAGVKYLDGFNVIPSYFTLAIFPLMSRYAKDSHESLVRAYQLAIRLLVMVALPIAILVTVLATPLIRILGGAAFLPDSALALTLLIWSIPVGFVNSVTQYVLIAVGQQRFLTRAFLIGVTFNVVANLIMIPRFGFAGAAVATILSEWSLLFPFYYAVRRHIAPLPWVDLVWRQGVAAAGMALAALALRGQPWIAAGASSLIYLALLLLLGAFRHPDIQRVLQVAPFFRKRAVDGERWSENG
jgi:O-antigen/teichoic acid export membrane protein